MGYETAFNGQFNVEPSFSKNHHAYLEAFSGSRRMERDEEVTKKLSDPIRKRVKLQVGKDGGYFVSGDGAPGSAFRVCDVGVVNSNTPPAGQPGLWCPWEPTDDRSGIWIKFENKHYNYIEWLQYILKHFLTPWGYKLSGRVTWQGESPDDVGFIIVYGNQVFVNQDPILEKLADAI